MTSTAFFQGKLYVAGEFFQLEGQGLVSFTPTMSGYTLFDFEADDAVISVAPVNDEFLVISGFSSSYLGQPVTGRLCYFDPSDDSITTLPIDFINSTSGDL